VVDPGNWGEQRRRRRTACTSPAGPAAAVDAVVAGWVVGQYSWVLVDQLTITQAATADATLGTPGIVEALNVATALPLVCYPLRLSPTDKSDRT
jgi:cytochrome bd ubiquinol oxidase subunit II